MTQEEILAMEPGESLDSLVAEKVMGWKWIRPENNAQFIQTSYAFNHEDGVAYLYFHPSSEISAAWEVEERIIAIAKEINPSVMNLCNFYIEKLRMVIIESNTFCTPFMLVHATPEQRCKAALLAVMDKEDESK